MSRAIGFTSSFDDPIKTDMDAPSNSVAHVAFVGLPGSGKSTVGRQLARRVGWPFLDTDQVIEKRIGLSIREFFEREGEEPFRDLEQAVIDELTSGEPCVLSTGGGAVLRPANREHLKQRSHAIYLHSSPEDVFRRLRHDQNRPLLQVTDPLARLRDLYALRDPLYRESVRFVVETGRPSVPALVHLIASQLETSGLVPAPRN
ncbi:shikimate kinase [Polaromonas eurypsychrophila]|uniref:Shikimate kinase n=2 Tax=Polaromonas eurypsychrophila TaxID=1614635 RepID=A0A916SCI4_9BURK|nr:shikimate kinase [Polaromonas eurypsychrophila]